jgi:TPR repeat protein
MLNLAVCLANGIGLEKNAGDGLGWFRRAWIAEGVEGIEELVAGG